MKISSYWKNFTPIVLDSLFPSECCLCSKTLRAPEKGLCSECKKEIKRLNSPSCLKCGKEIPRFATQSLCSECRKNERFFQKGDSCFKYNKTFSRIIRKIKHQKYFELLDTIINSDEIGNAACQNVDLVTSVPMTYFERFNREINISEVLAKKIAKINSIPYKKILKKIKTTKPQSELNRKERLTNLEDAFATIKKTCIVNKKILIVDDVFTTGSTLNEASKCLLKAGAKQVRVFTLARAGHYADS